MYEKEVFEVEQLIESQNRWRDTCINLIASENVVSQRAKAQAGSDFAHRYAEGHPGERYYSYDENNQENSQPVKLSELQK